MAIVKEATSSNSRGQKWTEQISREEQAYLLDVVAAMKKIPGAAPYVVAKKLRDELALAVGVGTIARTLKEMIACGQKKTK